VAAGEDGGVGEELGGGAVFGLVALADGLDGTIGDAALVGLAVDLAVAADFDLEPLGEGVDDRCADAVEAAGDLVPAAAEFSTCVEDGHDDLEGGGVHLGVLVDGDAAAIVGDGDDVVLADAADDGVAVAAECFVDGVIDDLADEVVEAAVVGGADVHAGAAADGLEALEDLDRTGVIV